MTDDDFRDIQVALMKTQIGLYEEQRRWEPWKVVITALAAGGAIFAGGAASLGLLLHLMGKI